MRWHRSALALRNHCNRLSHKSSNDKFKLFLLHQNCAISNTEKVILGISSSKTLGFHSSAPNSWATLSNSLKRICFYQTLNQLNFLRIYKLSYYTSICTLKYRVISLRDVPVLLYSLNKSSSSLSSIKCHKPTCIFRQMVQALRSPQHHFLRLYWRIWQRGCSNFPVRRNLYEENIN